MTCTSRRCATTGRPTARRRGFGPWRSAMPSMCVPTTGSDSRWYKAAIRQKAGRITAAGMTKEVTFEPVEGPINDRIDDAYRAKYKGSPYLSPMIGRRPPLRDRQGHAENFRYQGRDEMNVGVLGSGEVGQSLADGFLALGHQVMLGSRESGNPAASQWAKAAGPKGEGGHVRASGRFWRTHRAGDAGHGDAPCHRDGGAAAF